MSARRCFASTMTRPKGPARRFSPNQGNSAPMKISFAATRPAGDYALVIPSAGDNRPGLASIGDASKAAEAAIKRQRFEGDAATAVEHFLDGGQRVLIVGTGSNSK